MVTPRTSSSGRPASASVTARPRSAAAGTAGFSPAASEVVVDAAVAPLVIRSILPGSLVFCAAPSGNCTSLSNNNLVGFHKPVYWQPVYWQPVIDLAPLRRSGPDVR